MRREGKVLGEMESAVKNGAHMCVCGSQWDLWWTTCLLCSYYSTHTYTKKWKQPECNLITRPCPPLGGRRGEAGWVVHTCNPYVPLVYLFYSVIILITCTRRSRNAGEQNTNSTTQMENYILYRVSTFTHPERVHMYVYNSEGTCTMKHGRYNKW